MNDIEHIKQRINCYRTDVYKHQRREHYKKCLFAAKFAALKHISAHRRKKYHHCDAHHSVICTVEEHSRYIEVARTESGFVVIDSRLHGEQCLGVSHYLRIGLKRCRDNIYYWKQRDKCHRYKDYVDNGCGNYSACF